MPAGASGGLAFRAPSSAPPDLLLTRPAAATSPPAVNFLQGHLRRWQGQGLRSGAAWRPAMALQQALQVLLPGVVSCRRRSAIEAAAFCAAGEAGRRGAPAAPPPAPPAPTPCLPPARPQPCVSQEQLAAALEKGRKAWESAPGSRKLHVQWCPHVGANAVELGAGSYGQVFYGEASGSCLPQPSSLGVPWGPPRHCRHRRRAAPPAAAGHLNGDAVAVKFLLYDDGPTAAEAEARAARIVAASETFVRIRVRAPPCPAPAPACAVRQRYGQQRGGPAGCVCCSVGGQGVWQLLLGAGRSACLHCRRSSPAPLLCMLYRRPTSRGAPAARPR